MNTFDRMEEDIRRVLGRVVGHEVYAYVDGKGPMLTVMVLGMTSEDVDCLLSSIERG